MTEQMKSSLKMVGTEDIKGDIQLNKNSNGWRIGSNDELQVILQDYLMMGL
jgi:hypothetical protein